MHIVLLISSLLLVPVFGAEDYLGRCEKGGALMPPGLNPTPGRKYARDRAVNIKHLALDVTPDFTRRSVTGQVTIHFSPVAEKLTRLELDAVNLTIQTVSAEGAKVKGHSTSKDKLLVDFAEPIPATGEATLTVSYTCQPEHGIYFRTPEMGYPQGDMQLWTQGEAELHRYWFPCYDYPNDRFTSEIVCHAPEGMEVVSNGKLVSRDRDKDGPLIRWHWKQEQPHVNYLIALAAGHFYRLDAQAGRVPLALLVPPSEKDQAVPAFRDTQKIMVFFEEETGTPYPWDKYYQVYCHDFLAGGMENTSCSFMAGTALFPEAVGHLDTLHRLDAHELAHQWFGDLLTCRDWAHLWLNEGFASYYTVLYEEQKNGREGMLLSLQGEARSVIGANDPKPVVWRDYEHPMQQFDSRAYPKGAWILHMIRCRLGAELYRLGVQHYIRYHRDTNVVTDDLQQAFEAVSGRSFDQFFDQWVHHGGVPMLDIDYAWDADKKTARISVKQSQKTDGGIPVFAFPLPVRFIVKGEDGREVTEEFTASVSKVQEDFHWSLRGQPTLVRIDPELTVLAKLNFTPTGEMLDRQLRSDFMGRLLAVEALGEQKTDDAAAKLLAAASGDVHWAVRKEAVESLGKLPAASARTALISLVSQSDERVRQAVALALGALYHPEARDALIKLAATEQNPLILSGIVGALAAWPEVDLTPYLTRPSYQGMVASAVISALRARRQQSALPAVIEATKSQPFPPRALGDALRAIGSLGNDTKDESLLPFFTGYLTAPHDAVRTAACDALGELGDPRAIPALQKLASQSKNAASGAAGNASAKIQALDKANPQAVEAWKKVDALQRRVEELEKKLPAEKEEEKK